MNDYTHKELTRLVALHSLSLTPQELKYLMAASIEPDHINRYSIQRLVLHTNKAQQAAIKCLMEANKRDDWLRPLGWAYHFITDWGTSYHSFNNTINPIPKFAEKGKKMGEKLISYGGIEPKDELGMMWFTMGLSSLFGVKTLQSNHHRFEVICDERLKKTNKKHLLRRLEREKYNVVPKLNVFRAVMDILREETQELDMDWIALCSQEQFEWYMCEIMKAMELGTKIVLTN